MPTKTNTNTAVNQKVKMREHTNQIKTQAIQILSEISIAPVDIDLLNLDVLRSYCERSSLSHEQEVSAEILNVNILDAERDNTIQFTILFYPCQEEGHWLVKMYDKYTFAFIGANNQMTRVSKEPILRQTYRINTGVFNLTHEIINNIKNDIERIVLQLIKPSV